VTGGAQAGKVAGLLTLAVGGSALVAVGFLYQRGLPWVIIAVVLLALAVYAEGSYRLWDVADQGRECALRQLDESSSRAAVITRLSVLAQEMKLVRSGAPEGLDSSDWDGFREDCNDVVTRVRRELRLNAPASLAIGTPARQA